MSKQFEGLGEKWYTLLADPQKEIPQLVPFVLDKGATREIWQRKNSKTETIAMVWPMESSVRAAVIVQGPVDGQLKPVTVCPLLEGLPNDMTVDEVAPWASKVEGNIAVRRNEDGTPLWMYTPFLFRDAEDLTPDVRHTFVVAGLALGVRKALLDEMTITEGAQYEAFAKEWLESNPTATRLDVPQLKLSLEGSRILMPTDVRGDYQARVPVDLVEETMFADEKIYVLHVQFGLNTENPLSLVVYASEKICKGYVPQAGDEIDTIFWLQGRVIDC